MKRTLKWLIALLIILAVLFIPYSFFIKDNSAISDEQNIQMVKPETVKANNVSDKPKTPTETVERVEAEERIRFLLLGTDEREDEPARSDTIVLATYFPNEGKMNMLSIPRDTKVMINGKEEKINAAHAIGGADLVKETVEAFSGLSIDHVAKVNFNGFKELIDEAGGVTVNPKKGFSYAGYTFKEGEQTLSGDEALIYVRFRKDEEGDFGRIKRQQEVIQNTISAILSDFKLLSLPSYLNFYRQHVESDMSFGDMYNVAKTAYSNGVTLEGKTIPTTSTQEDGIWYELSDEASKEASLDWLEERPEEVLPSPHELEKAKQQSPRISGHLETP